jgi:hypothetical protein
VFIIISYFEGNLYEKERSKGLALLTSYTYSFFNTAVDFRARLRFPRVTREPRKTFTDFTVQLQGLEAHDISLFAKPFRFSDRSLHLALQSKAGTI